MKITQILQQLKKSNPKLADKYNNKHLLSVVEEQLFLRDYKNKFSDELKENSITDDEENEIELKPEELPIEEPTEEIPTEEPEIEEPEIQDKPQTEEEPEIEQEPEIQKKSDEDGEIEVNPETLPSDREEPEVTASKTEPEDKLSLKKPEGDGYIRISPTEARELLSYKGKIFTAIFVKRSDGSLRSLNGMTGVRKYTSGGELPYSPKEKELIPVYDLKQGPGKQGYRTIPLEGLKALKINGKKYKIDQALNEIKVNNPIKTWYDILKLMIPLQNKLGRNFILNKNKIYARELGWRENGQTITTYFKNNPNKIPIFYNKLKQLEQDNIQENMKKITLKQLIKEILQEVKLSKKSIKENQPTPQRQMSDREVIEKPKTDTPERKPKRRTLNPPTESPETRPKAESVIKENDKEIANKIADRFKKLK